MLVVTLRPARVRGVMRVGMMGVRSREASYEVKAMSSRALRRHHEERIKRRVAGYYGGYARGKPCRLGKLAHARKLCSCWMCGNPRRYLGEPTLQERRAAAAAPIIASAI